MVKRGDLRGVDDWFRYFFALDRHTIVLSIPKYIKKRGKYPFYSGLIRR